MKIFNSLNYHTIHLSSTQSTQSSPKNKIKIKAKNSFIKKENLHLNHSSHRTFTPMEITVSYIGCKNNKLGIYKGKILNIEKQKGYNDSLTKQQPLLNILGVKFNNKLLNKLSNEINYLNFDNIRGYKKLAKSNSENKDKPLFLCFNNKKKENSQKNINYNIHINNENQGIIKYTSRYNYEYHNIFNKKSNNLMKNNTQFFSNGPINLSKLSNIKTPLTRSHSNRKKNRKILTRCKSSISSKSLTDKNFGNFPSYSNCGVNLNFDKALSIKKITEDQLSKIKRGYSAHEYNYSDYKDKTKVNTFNISPYKRIYNNNIVKSKNKNKIFRDKRLYEKLSEDIKNKNYSGIIKGNGFDTK